MDVKVMRGGDGEEGKYGIFLGGDLFPLLELRK